ncbi:MAG: nicotinamide riboside transporter PnuC [Brevinema sp.]
MISLLRKELFLSFYVFFSVIFIGFGLYTDLKTTYTLFGYIGRGLSTCSSLLAVYFVILEIKEKFSMFIVSIISSIFTIIYLWFYSPLIWDMAISYFYLSISIYGIISWNKKSKHCVAFEQSPPTRLSLKQSGLYTLVALISIVILFVIGYHIGKYTSAIQAFVDSITSVTAIIAWWFTIKKYIAAWYLWIFINTLSVPLYISVGSWTMAMLYTGYIFVSFYGLRSWKNSMR